MYIITKKKLIPSFPNGKLDGQIAESQVPWEVPHLHGEAGSPLGPPPAVSLAVAVAPAALFSLFSNWGSHSWSPVFPLTAPSVESLEKAAAVMSLTQPGKQET